MHGKTIKKIFTDVRNVETSTNVALLTQDPKILCSNRSSRIMKPDRPYVELHSTALFNTRSYVESHSTALSALPGPISSHTRQRFPLFQVQCRVTLDSAFRFFRSMSSHIRQRLALTGLMSSHTRQRFSPFQV